MSAVRQYVLFHPAGKPSAAELARVLRRPGLKIIDRTARRAFLIKTTPAIIADLRRELTGWTIAEEKIHPPPAPAPPPPEPREG